MSKSYCSLGLMSGTSMDGVDASIIQSDGKTKYKAILDKYFEYPKSIYKNLTTLRDKIKSSKDLKKHEKQIKSVEKEITIFHAESVNKILKKTKSNVNFIGFHGQTIFHNSSEKISIQLGNGKLLSKLIKKTVVYNFRKNDLKNDGHGTPLTPIFHKLLKTKFKIKYAAFVNIGGIVNVTCFNDIHPMKGTDVGPGMCLIDQWVRQNSKKKYDQNGIIAKSGKVNKIVLDQLAEDFIEREYHSPSDVEQSLDVVQSFDIKDFDLSFVKNLSLEDGAATLTQFTANIISPIFSAREDYKEKIILCGGGRKNNFLVEKLKKNSTRIKLIDDYGVNGDFVESQAFAYLAIRSYLNLPISFPSTTGVSKPCTGGIIIKNF